MKKNLVIVRPRFKYRFSGSIEIAAIKFLHHLLRIDFVSYRDIDAYNYWLNIREQTFIRTDAPDVKFTMIKVSGIPIAPRRHYFFNKGSEKRFSLFFPMPPSNTTCIDIIENEPAGTCSCNFYGVSLREVALPEHNATGITLALN